MLKEELGKMKPLDGRVIVHNMEKGERMIGKIILRDDNSSSRGIRARWAQVFKVGEGIDDIKEGQWILIEHGRWSRALDFNDVADKTSQEYVLHRVDYPSGVLAVSDEAPEGFTLGVE